MIVDASVVVKWFVVEPLREEAREVLLADDELIAPDVVTVEVANALWAKSRRGELGSSEAARAIAAVCSGGVPQLRSTPPLVSRAFELAGLLDHPVYDCLYLALAERLDLSVVTADRRFVDAAAKAFDQRVRLLA